MYVANMYKTATQTAQMVLESQGRTVEMSYEFEAIIEEIDQSSKVRINDEASPYVNELTGRNCVYLIVRDRNGRLEGFASLRLLQIGEEKLLGYLRRQFRRLYGHGQMAFDDKDVPAVVHRISGEVGFISDIFIERSARGQGGLDVGDLLVLAYAQAALRWRVDWIYGFTKDRDVRRGLAGRYFASRLYPSAIKWSVETLNRRDDDWLLCFDRDDYEYVLHRYVQSVANAA
jgi:hypothetical protein